MASALSAVDRSPYAFMAMVLPDGRPYGIPVSAARIGDCIYFHCAKSGLKIDALRNDPHVCISFVGDVVPMEDEFSTEYESAIAMGRAEEIDGEEKIEALRAICLRYTPSNMAAFDDEIARSLARTGVWRIRMESLSGKRKRKAQQKS